MKKPLLSIIMVFIMTIVLSNEKEIFSIKEIDNKILLTESPQQWTQEMVKSILMKQSLITLFSPLNGEITFYEEYYILVFKKNSFYSQNELVGIRGKYTITIDNNLPEIKLSPEKALKSDDFDTYKGMELDKYIDDILYYKLREATESEKGSLIELGYLESLGVSCYILGDNEVFYSIFD